MKVKGHTIDEITPLDIRLVNEPDEDELYEKFERKTTLLSNSNKVKLIYERWNTEENDKEENCEEDSGKPE